MELSISLSPQVLFNIGSFSVTNAFFWSVILTLVLIVVVLRINKKKSLVPGRVQGFFELILEGAYDFVKSITGSEAKTKKVFPLVFTMFLFILAANLATFIPGQAAFSVVKGDSSISLFRAVMADYSLVFMMTVITIITTQIVAVMVHGPFGYIGKFINISGFKKVFKSKDGIKVKIGILAQAFLDFFLGVMDIVGEIAKIVSLSFRLFGNIFAGEVLASVMLFIGFSVVKMGFLKVGLLVGTGNILVASLVNLPFVFLGLLTAVVQAFVFSVLTLIFITMASEIEEDELAEKVTI